MEELLDVLDENYQVIGQDTRSNVHDKELLHGAFHCWFYSVENTKPYILFQKRNSQVNYPNLLDITAAGHLATGEGPVDGAREIKEELGVNVSFDELVSMGQFRDALPGKNNKTDHEWCHLYAYHYEKALNELILQKSEVEGLVRISIEDFNYILQSSKKYTFEALTFDGKVVEWKSVRLSLDDFVPHKKEYYQFVIDKLQGILHP